MKYFSIDIKKNPWNILHERGFINISLILQTFYMMYMKYSDLVHLLNFGPTNFSDEPNMLKLSN